MGYLDVEGKRFYVIRSAKEQLENRDIWRKQVQEEEYNRIRKELVEQINQLWRLDKGWINFWESNWFPGTEDFLKDLQALGYHVYKDKGNFNQKYIISLDELSNRIEWVGE